MTRDSRDNRTLLKKIKDRSFPVAAILCTTLALSLITNMAKEADRDLIYLNQLNNSPSSQERREERVDIFKMFIPGYSFFRRYENTQQF
jgi:hypothetical protein